MSLVEERYNLELPPEVQEKMARAQQRLITETEVSDLKYVPLRYNAYYGVKRVLDLIAAVLLLPVLLIPMLIISLLIYVDDPGKILFVQYRVGRNGKRFKFYKFRTMKKETPKYLATAEVKDPERYITRLGKFLRRSSLDELPQLLNVIKGDMSLIGPRPLISDEYEVHHMRMRFGVYQLRPGVTGLAQINGRDTVSPAQKVHWDVKYLEEFGFFSDFKIMLATIPKVFGASNVVEGNENNLH